MILVVVLFGCSSKSSDGSKVATCTFENDEVKVKDIITQDKNGDLFKIQGTTTYTLTDEIIAQFGDIDAVKSYFEEGKKSVEAQGSEFSYEIAKDNKSVTVVVTSVISKLTEDAKSSLEGMTKGADFVKVRKDNGYTCTEFK